MKKKRRISNDLLLCISVLYLATIGGGVVVALADPSLDSFLIYTITMNVVGAFLALGIYAAL